MATRWIAEENGTYAEYVAEGTKVHRRLFQPQRKEQLQNLAEVRKNGVRKMDWGRQIAEIPIPDLIMLRKFFGDALFNDKHDKFERKRAREAFLKSPASDPYRTEYRRKMGGQ